MSDYRYRTPTQQAIVNVKTTVKNAMRAVKETLRSMELIQRPEVRITRNLPALPDLKGEPAK